MFNVGSDWPGEVRKPLLAPRVTNEVVKLAIEVCNDLCNGNGRALLCAFGNFDRCVAIGWLLADAVGRSLLSGPEAHTLGIKAQCAGVAAKTAVSAARRKALADV